ncbi:hypothetical protein P9E34_19675 [Schinkia azotoformans]|uniref:hypothetical protein n=1 Tax=Schinkia azotoformans TaxID=1454 RepID=UPI002DBE3E3A|nr:hypothetical protein [Schinkia azotoformans]MEC1726932.1 hypothetical protein [Schinkia azotoformans]
MENSFELHIQYNKLMVKDLGQFLVGLEKAYSTVANEYYKQMKKQFNEVANTPNYFLDFLNGEELEIINFEKGSLKLFLKGNPALLTLIFDITAGIIAVSSSLMGLPMVAEKQEEYQTDFNKLKNNPIVINDIEGFATTINPEHFEYISYKSERTGDTETITIELKK